MSSSTHQDITDDRITARDVANPFRMLSAYLIVAATSRPPPDWRNKRKTTAGV